MKEKYANSIINFFLCLYIVLLPFEEAIAFGGITALRVVSIVIIVLSLVASNGRIRLNSFVLPLAIWMLFSFISFLWSISISESWKFYKIYLIQFVLIVSIFSIPKNVINLEKINKSFIFSAFIASTLIFVLPSSTITKDGRRAITLFDTMLDPNIVSSIIVIGVLLALIYFIKAKGFKRIIWIVLAGYEALGTMLTGSRGGFLSLFVGIVVLFFIYRKSIFRGVKSFVVLALGIIAIVVVIRLIPSSLIENRFSIDALFGQNEIGVHSRSTIWSYIPGLFVQKPFLGWGAGNFPEAMATVYRYSAGHNMYFIVLLETGILGFFIFLWFLIKLFTESKKASIDLLPILLSTLFSCFFLDGLTDKYLWAAILLCGLYVGKIKDAIANPSVSFERKENDKKNYLSLHC